MREVYKDVQIGEHSYRIAKMTARDGCWLAMQVMSYMMPAAVQVVAAQMGSPIPVTGQSRTMTEAEFHNIQDHCLAMCTRAKQEANAIVWYPLFHDSGKANFDDLESDVVTFMVLTIHALLFNLKPFFGEGMEKITQAVTEAMRENGQPTSLTGVSVPSQPDSGVIMKRGTARIS